jgi:hypothetical protein
MAAPLHRQTISLIVRVWAEYLNDQPPAWRGVIEGAEPGDINPFTSLDELTRIIQQKTIEETHPPNTKIKRAEK